MIACRISQIGTSTVGTNDQGAYCIASEPGPAKICNGEPSDEVMPKAIAATRSAAPNRFQAAIAVVWRAASFSSHSTGTATTPVMMSPQAALYGNGPVSRPSAASRRNSTAKTRTMLSATITGIGMLSIALRAAGQTVASAVASSGTTTNSPTTGTGRAIGSQPAPATAAARPIQTPITAANVTLATRETSMKVVKALTTSTIKAAVITMPMKSSMLLSLQG